MRATFRLGRIAGVRVGVHWTVAVIFAVIAVGLAQSRLPDVYPGHSWALYWVVGLLTAVVFLASLLAHELAHAVVAKRNGVAVDDIVLWLLGGVARLRGEAPTPGAEFRLAGVGPLVSLVLGVVFGLAAWGVHAAFGAGLAVDALAWLAVINIVLAVFNAIPAAPLDGGRLLHAAMWRRSGDRLRATVGASTAGRGFGWALVLLGLFLFVRGDTVGGVWTALIGWFLTSAATLERRQAEVRRTLAGIPVRNAMTREPVTMTERLTVADVLNDAEHRYRHPAFPVTDDAEAPVGLMTLNSARHVPEKDRNTVTVRDVMVPLARVDVVGPDEPLADIVPRLDPVPEHRVMVVAHGRCVGVVSASDVNDMVTWLVANNPQSHSR
ncbi:site-2 protease family protein [Yinghuangia sp. ASG 101]|uniref:site-2 protease family protein n=1 Tax=Yinghuangia sp. ASG 101 TaxID=2896848 RepID=UPI001E61FD13|nr:site-2 protease family protein [Yinghuangia sp. ASG 101]UGQ11683.1 site-2 protease family protein [Yinghuangia sp. ASG 101]